MCFVRCVGSIRELPSVWGDTELRNTSLDLWGMWVCYQTRVGTPLPREHKCCPVSVSGIYIDLVLTKLDRIIELLESLESR